MLIEVLSFCKHLIMEFLAKDLFTKRLKSFNMVSFDLIQWVSVAAIADLPLLLVESCDCDFIFFWSSFP
jgi:hypothetical protein